MNISDKQLEETITAMRAASIEVMRIYDSGALETKLKIDESPVTSADIASNQILTKAFSEIYPDIPIVSEEGDEEYNKRIVAESSTFWLIDPLDGTKDFIDRTNHFCVAAGLIEDGKPVFGIVAAPADGSAIYYGGKATGSFKKVGAENARQLHVKQLKPQVLLRSRSHENDETIAYIEKNFPNVQHEIAGSMLKYLYIAEGKGSVSPRLGTKMKLWDLAAGTAILQGAGGDIATPSGSPLDFHDKDLVVSEFVAFAYPPA